MKQLFLLYFLLVSALSFAQVESVIPNPSNPPKLVNDFTGRFLTPEQAQTLERKLVAYDDSTSNQIAVVIVDDLKGYSRDDYAIALGRKWGVGGQKQFNNGVVILVNAGPKDRGLFIATGYGLEGAITDLIADQIIQQIIIPDFKLGDNYRGLDEGTDALIQAAAGRFKAPEGYRDRGKGPGVGTVIVLVIVIIIFISFMSRGGGGGGGYVSRRGYRGGGGWIIPGGWSGGGGGGWSGGGGGGGFGGFGGGGFGGGGAGGSW
ncbi:TPM domain-containing protein [Niabella beijingensis]|uniref:TPM domain-containing protein n=1 Tax=Niabella beijingensis TaxID=2872700 RepID=UPI001CBFE277|nr:TPM domain-containing protein [Niabella beijingensis]MBZ4190429.1 TPM domain-containing protein [Niabella beijingensis]